MSHAPTPVNLDGRRVLVVEDTFLIADLISETLTEHGCSVLGPVARLRDGLAAARDEAMDGALLDVNLAGERCFPIADALTGRAIPFAFLTGYGDAGIPPAYQQVPRLAKPFTMPDLVRLVHALINR